MPITINTMPSIHPTFLLPTPFLLRTTPQKPTNLTSHKLLPTSPKHPPHPHASLPLPSPPRHPPPTPTLLPPSKKQRTPLAILGTLTYILSLLFKNNKHVAVHAKSSSTHTVAHFTIGDRVGFWMGEFLMWNPFARVFALILATVVFIVLGGRLFKMADPKGEEMKSPVWTSFRAFCNPLEDNFEKNSLRAASMLVAGFGLVVFAILVGMVTDSVDSAVKSVDGGSSKVTISGHTLVCGWNSRVSPILKDISVVEPRTKVVVLASEEEKKDMMDSIKREFGSGRKNFRLFYRPGTSVLQEDLNRVAADYASKILLVGDNLQKEDSDRKVLSRALALREHLPNFKGDIIAELNDARDEKILKSVLESTTAKSVQTVNSDRLLFRFMAQAIQQPGLPDIIGRLMGNDATTIFHVEPVSRISQGLVGTRFSSLGPTSVPGVIVCGYVDDVDGTVKLGLGTSHHELTPNSQLVLLGRADQRFIRRSGIEEKAFVVGPVKAKRNTFQRKVPESVLVCGWRSDMHEMLNELDLSLAPGSKVVILDDDAPDHLPRKFNNLSIFVDRRRPDRFEHLEALLGEKEKPYNHIVLLSSALRTASTEDSIEEDSKGLATLMYLNELVGKQLSSTKKPLKTSITIEFSNPRVAEIAKNERAVSNIILPENLSAKIASQAVRNPKLNSMWKELLSQHGHEVYFRKANSFVPASQEASFSRLADIAQETKDEIALGYISKGKAPTINPTGAERETSRTWDADDMLICLARE